MAQFKVNRHIDLLAQQAQLFHRCGALKVGSHQHWFAASLFGCQRQLSSCGGFALPLKAAQHHDGWPIFAGCGQCGIDRAHQGNQLVVHTLEDLFARVDRAQDCLANRFFGDTSQECFDNLMMDIRIEQGSTHVLHGITDIGFGEPSASAQALERLTTSWLQAFEHGARHKRKR